MAGAKRGRRVLARMKSGYERHPNDAICPLLSKPIEITVAKYQTTSSLEIVVPHP
jgi:hypothetical protein